MTNLFEKIEIGTQHFYCEMCGEVACESKYLVLDDVAGIPADIEAVCEYCRENWQG